MTYDYLSTVYTSFRDARLKDPKSMEMPETKLSSLYIVTKIELNVQIFGSCDSKSSHSTAEAWNSIKSEGVKKTKMNDAMKKGNTRIPPGSTKHGFTVYFIN